MQRNKGIRKTFAVCMLGQVKWGCGFLRQVDESYMSWKKKNKGRNLWKTIEAVVKLFPNNRWSFSIDFFYFFIADELYSTSASPVVALLHLCCVHQPRAFKVESSSRWLTCIITWTCLRGRRSRLKIHNCGLKAESCMYVYVCPEYSMFPDDRRDWRTSAQG